MASWMITDDVLFRIQVTLSSRKTKVETFRTVAQAYSLEGTDNPQWQSIAIGVPCTIKQLESADEDSRFELKFAMADIQSGLSVWEEYVTADANYYAYQETFHTFKGKSGKRFGVRVSEPNVAVNILEHMYDLSLELGKQEASENAPEEGKDADNPQNAKVVKRRLRRINTLSKKDISLPCNFVHVSGVSKEKDQSSGEQLSNFLERKMKSLSAIVLPSHGRKVKKSPTNHRSSTDISHERIFAKALATSSQPSTPKLDNKKPGSNVVQRNTWNFGMLRKQSGGSIKAEKPRKGLFRRNSFSGLSSSHSTSTEDVVISAPVVTNKPAALAHQRSPDLVQPCLQDQASSSPEPRLQSCSPPYTTASASRYTPSPPSSASPVDRMFRVHSNFHYNTLPSNLRRSHSTAGCIRHHVPRSTREEYDTLAPKDYDTLAPKQPTEPMTLTRYKTEPSGIYQPTHYSTSTMPRSDVPQRSCGSTSDLLLRRPVRSQYPHMKEEEITAAAAATIARYTERMAKALQQFDDALLHDSPNPSHNSTVVC